MGFPMYFCPVLGFFFLLCRDVRLALRPTYLPNVGHLAGLTKMTLPFIRKIFSPFVGRALKFVVNITDNLIFLTPLAFLALYPPVASS